MLQGFAVVARWSGLGNRLFTIYHHMSNTVRPKNMEQKWSKTETGRKTFNQKKLKPAGTRAIPKLHGKQLGPRTETGPNTFKNEAKTRRKRKITANGSLRKAVRYNLVAHLRMLARGELWT